MFLKILQNSQENSCARVSILIKLQALRPWGLNFIKIVTLAQVFSCVFCKISKNTFSCRTPQVAASAKLQHPSFEMNSKITNSHWSYFVNCFIKSPIELEVKILKNTYNFTSGLKPATLVRDEFCKDFHDSFYHSHFCGKSFGDFLSKKIYFKAISKNEVQENTSLS